ncbi:hypothetical protein [Streptomyces sp. NBC_01233]|uniref:hypothetical protein n=1 Tax=Streptomyces sp. NBC_01233 TaxID=2903787 RepID=UPI002E131F11|nr:hypothetical protein OG332_18635 [Streptomyces sp. NBC_01233]
MDTAGTARASGPTGKAAPSGSRRARNSLFWAALIAGGGTLGGFISQFPYGLLYVGVLIVLAAAGLGAAVAGSNWNRAGAAAIVGFGTMALGLFAGSNLNESYLKVLGERVDAVVVEAREYANSKGDARFYCRVVDTSGESHELDAIQNCYAEVAPGGHVVLFEDRLGGLDPWMETTGSRALDPLGLGITGGLFLLIGGTMFTAGQRRRSDEDVHQKHLRKHGPARRPRE